MSPRELSLYEARLISLNAQGFHARGAAKVSAPALKALIRRLAVVQLDFVNVLVPAHYLVFYSRLGPYRRALLDKVFYGDGEFTEQWAHEASIVPIETWPLLRHRREGFRLRPWGFDRFMAANPDYVARVLDAVRRRGPMAADEAPLPEDGPSKLGRDFFSDSVARAVLEAFFARGVVAVRSRRPDFSRLYDLAERVIPPALWQSEPSSDDAGRLLLEQAARACGVATAADLADYFRTPVGATRPRIAALVESGRLEPVRVEGWRELAYLHRDAQAAATAAAAASLLAPFDPLIWFRPRTQRLFRFEYRFEIFVPETKRRWGCYVLPFLLGDRLVARVDLKADRREGRLRVVKAYLESGVKPGPAGEALRAELARLAGWLGLEKVAIESWWTGARRAASSPRC